MPEEKNPKIEYRPIAGYPGYEVGADGSVWSRLKRGSWRTTVMKDTWHRLSAGYARGDYRNVSLSRDGKRKTRLVHQLVLEAFIGPCPDGMEVCHAPDRDRSNNAVTNLRWGTRTDNARDRDRDGKTARGTNNGNSCLTEEIVREIRLARGYGVVSQLARKHGISRQTAHHIRTRKAWAHVL